MNKKEQDTQEVKDALKIFWDALQSYKKGRHHNNFNRILLNLENPLKGAASWMKVDLGAKKFKVDQTTNARAIEPAQPEPEEQPEERVVAADNADTPKAKKRATKRRKSSRSKKKDSE